MSGELPPDVRNWPDDPWTLLGLDSDTDRNAARSAYVRLIRKYKPDQFPEEFQRIRAAYERVQSAIEFHATYYSDVVDQTNDDNQTIDDEPQDEVERVPGAVREIESHRQQLAAQQRIVETRESAWKSAIGGGVAEAYRQLVTMIERHRDDDLAIRLYWLLKAAPQIDSKRTAADWLVYALEGSPRPGWLVLELYQRELESNSVEALSDRCRTTIGKMLPADWATPLAISRWREAAFVDNMMLISNDVEQWRSKCFDSDVAWSRLLAEAIQQIIWSDNELVVDAVTRFREELDQMNHVHDQIEHQLDLLEVLQSLWHQWHGLAGKGNLASIIRNVLPASWSGSDKELRQAIWPLVEQIGALPFSILEKLDQMRHRFTTALIQTSQAIERYSGIHPRFAYDDWENQDVQALARWFLQSQGGKSYRDVRRPLAQFCIDYAAPPMLVGHLAKEVWPDKSAAEELSQAIQSDASLKAVTLGYRLFWS